MPIQGTVATAVACALIDECLATQARPGWHCLTDNDGSSALALKLGFEPHLEFPIYRHGSLTAPSSPGICESSATTSTRTVVRARPRQMVRAFYSLRGSTACQWGGCGFDGQVARISRASRTPILSLRRLVNARRSTRSRSPKNCGARGSGPS